MPSITRETPRSQASADSKPVWRPAGRASAARPAVASSASKISHERSSRYLRKTTARPSETSTQADSRMPTANRSAANRRTSNPFVRTVPIRCPSISKVEYLSRRAKLPVVTALGPRPRVLALPNSLGWNENAMGSVCNTNLLVYFGVPESDLRTLSDRDAINEGNRMNNTRRRMRAAVADAFYKANPTLLLEDRFYFQERTWQGYWSLQNDLPQYMDDLIANHRVLCDLQEERLRLARDRTSEQVGQNSSDEPFSLDSTTMLMPIIRSVILCVYPGLTLDAIGISVDTTCSLILTGDDAGLRSGPLTLGTVTPFLYSKPQIVNERVINLSLAEAVYFLTALDEREVAANPALRARNEVCAERIRQRWPAEEAEKPLPRSLTATIYGNGLTMQMGLRDEYDEA